MSVITINIDFTTIEGRQKAMRIMKAEDMAFTFFEIDRNIQKKALRKLEAASEKGVNLDYSDGVEAVMQLIRDKMKENFINVEELTY